MALDTKPRHLMKKNWQNYFYRALIPFALVVFLFNSSKIETVQGGFHRIM